MNIEERLGRGREHVPAVWPSMLPKGCWKGKEFRLPWNDEKINGVACGRDPVNPTDIGLCAEHLDELRETSK